MTNDEYISKQVEPPQVAVPSDTTVFDIPNREWSKRVQPASDDVYAFRPNQLLIQGDDNARNIVAYLKGQGISATTTTILDDEVLISSDDDFDVQNVVATLQKEGFDVEPNVVMFGHGTARCCCDHCGAATGTGFGRFDGAPFNGNPFNGNPFNGNPFNGNPFNGNPFNGNPFNGNAKTGERPSSAVPTKDPGVGKATKLPTSAARVIVLDTGIVARGQLPDTLHKSTHYWANPAHRDSPDIEPDGTLDPVSGHGSFIAGVIEQVAPNQEVHVVRVLSTYGDGDAATIAGQIGVLIKGGWITDRTILNMSFGSYGDLKMYLVERAIKKVQDLGGVVVASAGNDNTSLRSYPACLPDVVSVGSIEPNGRAAYSNYGCWVDACAPGTAVVSSFFRDFNSSNPPIPGTNPPLDPDHYQSWAEWTGTSFAAPIVAGVLARHIALTDETAKEAVEMVINAPGLYQQRDMGTVINVVPGA